YASRSRELSYLPSGDDIGARTRGTSLVEILERRQTPRSRRQAFARSSRTPDRGDPWKGFRRPFRQCSIGVTRPQYHLPSFLIHHACFDTLRQYLAIS